jgi:hypothetical protein
MRNFVTWHNYKCDHGQCVWSLYDGTLTVRTQHGTKSVRHNGDAPECIARVLIWEIESDLDGIKE